MSLKNWNVADKQENFYSADQNITQFSPEFKICGSVFTISGSSIGKIVSLASFPGPWHTNANEAFLFDMAVGPLKGSGSRQLEKYDYPRGQASLRLALGDQDISQDRRFSLNSKYMAIVIKFLAYLEECGLQRENPEDFFKDFLQMNLPDATMGMI